MTWYYFVSYAFARDGQNGRGWIEVPMPFEITRGGDVRLLERDAARLSGTPDLVITGFQLLRKDSRPSP